MPGDPDHYPHRDEVVDYLRRYAEQLGADIRTGHRVQQVTHTDAGFAVALEDGPQLTAPMVIAATGGFARPHWPALPGLDTYAGTPLHARNYRDPPATPGSGW